MNILVLRKILFKVFYIILNTFSKIKHEEFEDQVYYRKFFLFLRNFKKKWYYNIGNMRVYYDPTLSAIGQRIFFDGSFEESYLKLCSKYVKPDSVVFDIGSNIGIHSIYFSNIAVDGRIYSFEPSISTFQLLLNNIKHCKNIVPINTGISDISSLFTFYECDDNALSSLKDTQRSSIQNRYEVLCFNLDDFIKLFSINRVDFVKIDVEGLEYEVLQGMKNAIIEIQTNNFL